MAKDELPCKYCAQVFHTQTEWKTHVSTNHDVTGYPCDLCKEVFYKKLDYIQHFDREHNSDFNRHVCSTCGVSYKWFKFLAQHIKKKHQVETLMQCDHCGEEFYNVFAFQQHLKLKHAPGKKFHKCKKCHRSFSAKLFLRMHDRFDHSKRGVKLFKEYVLDKLTLNDESLLNCTKKCSQCDLKFSSLVYLFKHFKQAHDRMKYYLCCACNEAVYNTRAGLSIHLHHEHGFAREHKCAKCMVGHLTPPKTEKRDKVESSIVKEETEIVLIPWADQFKSQGIPENLDLVDASDTEISNLRSNIRNLFHLLATATPSRLKSAHKVDAKTDTFFSMKTFKSAEFDKGRSKRYALKPQNLQFEKSNDLNEATTTIPSPVAEEVGKEGNENAEVANVNTVEEESVKNLFQCQKQGSANAEATNVINVKEKSDKTKVQFQGQKEGGAKAKHNNVNKVKKKSGRTNDQSQGQKQGSSKRKHTNASNVKEKSDKSKFKFQVQKEGRSNPKHTNVNNVKEKSGQTKVQFQCHKCKDKFAYRKALHMHQVEVHGFRGFPISSCQSEKERQSLSMRCEEIEKENASSKNNSVEPINIETKVTCNICNIEFTEQRHLLDHLTEKHTNNSKHVENPEIVVYKCSDCYVAYNTESELDEHMKVHAKYTAPTSDENVKKMCKVCKTCLKKPKTVYRCLKCHKRFASRNVLRRHIVKQHRTPTFKCTKCIASFRVADKLKQHMKLKHNAETTTLPVLKIQKSKLSPIKLDKLPNILSNILTRNLLNGTLHNCKICNSYFPSNELLQRHIQWEHTKNVNLHKCGQCNQVLYSVEDLELHMSAAHNNEGPFKWKKQIAFNYEHQTDI